MARPHERILAMGVTGSGKSWQWLKLAEELLPTKAIFRCLDTDNAITFMLETQFPHLKPENKGNVLVHPTFEWPDYERGIAWIMRKPLKVEELESVDPYLARDYKSGPVKPDDWTIVDRGDNPWKASQSYFVEQVFGASKGEYFLQIRKEMEAGLRKTAKGGMPSSVLAEGLDGWRDWGVINSLYDDYILPIIFRLMTHVYIAVRPEPINRDEKDAELKMLFGDLGVRPAGQKELGHQMHSIFLFIPGKDRWYIVTAKDRGSRTYFNRVELKSFYMQYLIAKAGWPLL